MEKILISGGSGLVGTALTKLLMSETYEVKILTRQKSLVDQDKSYLHWDVKKEIIDLQGYQPDHVINLTGAGIADERWTDDRKETLINSRTKTTSFLIDSLKDLGVKKFISASAIGYYGDTGDQWVTEEDAPVTKDFLSKVCQLWEKAAAPAKDIAKEVVIVRIGTVLSRDGGALEKMDKTIPYGMANYLGSGKQYLSWIHIDDLCRLFLHILRSEKSASVYNAVATDVVTNKAFTQQLRKTINPSSLLAPAPRIALKLLLGEMAAVVLNNSRIKNQRILDEGFKLLYPDVKSAVEQLYQ